MNQGYWDFIKKRDDVKIKKNKNVITSPKPFIAEKLKSSEKILDFGAGNKRLLTHLKKAGFVGEYKTCDTDRSIQHDFYSVDEIDGEYDAITLIEVLEHLPYEDAIETLKIITNRLKPGGIIIITVPNVMCPGAQEQMDCTHIQHWPPLDLCAILLMFGFKNKFELFRVYLEYFWGLKHYRAFLNKIIRKLIALDYCQGIILIGEKQI